MEYLNKIVKKIKTRTEMFKLEIIKNKKDIYDTILFSFLSSK